MMELRVDPNRVQLPMTGIPVRAKYEGLWTTVDIVALDVRSLNAWLRSRGGENPWAESVVRVLLGHPVEPGEESP